MQVVYFEHYPHMSGTMNARVVMEDHEFFLLLALLSVYGSDDGEFQDESAEDFCDLLEARVEKDLYALSNTVCDAKDKGKRIDEITTDLTNKGWWFGEWEEGSFYFAFPEDEKEAKAALILRESQVLADSGEFD